MDIKKQQILAIKLKAYDHKILDTTVANFISTLRRIQVSLKGPIPLPNKTKIYTVIRSPHIFKNSREVFKRTTFTRKIDVITDSMTTEAFKKVEVPAGVEIEIKLTEGK